jgi:hypothetical protein
LKKRRNYYIIEICVLAPISLWPCRTKSWLILWKLEECNIQQTWSKQRPIRHNWRVI